MAEETEEVDDPLLQRLARIKKEFVTHRERLKERSKELGDMITRGEITDAHMPKLIMELYLELQDTSLSLQEDLASIVYDDWTSPDEEDEDDEELDDEGDDEDLPVDDGERDPSQLLPDDAKQLRRTALDYAAMLDAMMKQPGFENFTPAQRQEINDKLADAQASVDLIDALELRDDATAN